MRYLLAIAVLLLWASSASAQKLDLPTVAFASAATADWVTTHENMKYFHEANPMLSWLDHKPNAMIAVGVGMDVATYYGWSKLTKNKPKLRAIGLYSAAAFRVFIAARNVRHLQKHRPR